VKDLNWKPDHPLQVQLSLEEVEEIIDRTRSPKRRTPNPIITTAALRDELNMALGVQMEVYKRSHKEPREADNKAVHERSNGEPREADNKAALRKIFEGAQELADLIEQHPRVRDALWYGCNRQGGDDQDVETLVRLLKDVPRWAESVPGYEEPDGTIVSSLTPLETNHDKYLVHELSEVFDFAYGPGHGRIGSSEKPCPRIRFIIAVLQVCGLGELRLNQVRDCLKK